MGDEHASTTPEPEAPTRRPTPPAPTRRPTSPIQARLSVGPVGDRFEQEADRVAAEVMRTLDRTAIDDDVDPTAVRPARRRVSRIARATAPVGLDGGALDADTDGAIRSAAGGGRPLEAGVRQSMERGFGVDFSSVRVHADRRADDLNGRVGARAFTTGPDIFFSQGQYDPTSRGGRELLAHELTHVVQQGGARVARRPADTDQTSISESAAGRGRSKITLSGRAGVIGSVVVTATDRSSVEATDLAVDAGERGQGYGSDLVAAAARSAEGSGHSRITLGSQDDGTGHLDGWYRSLGFSATGTSGDSLTRFEAPTSILRSAELRESRRIRRMKADWYELVGDDVVARVGKKPGGMRMVKGRKAPDGKTAVFQTADQKAATTEKAKTYDEEVGDLPDAGDFFVKSAPLRFSQDSIGKKFSDGGSIYDLAKALTDGTTKASALPAIRIFWTKGKKPRLVTLDNRRLWCCKQAGVDIKCTWATEDEVRDEAYKFTSSQGKDGSTLVTVRG
jgi:ribosomal protein S18 acetylase RimI-like enzyme